MQAPLHGIRVLDLSRLLPGPFCSMVLADHGAEVIKVEDTEAGDYMRWYPPLAGQYSALFYSVNRNKKSITLNLKSAKGKELFLQLVKNCDIVLEGFRPGVMDGLGLGYDVLQAVNPRLIYCAITGYGQNGPRAREAGHDVNYLNLTGISALIGHPNEVPPLCGVQIADLGGGALWGVIGILLALSARERTGKGQLCDVSMTDGVLSWLPLITAEWTMDKKAISRGTGTLGGGLACYHIYPTADGKFMGLGALEPKFWQSFCQVIGKPEFIDCQFMSDSQEELIEVLSDLFATKNQDEWVDIFQDHQVCLTPVKELAEVMLDPHFESRNMWIKVATELHEFAFPGPPIKLEGTRTGDVHTYPAHGQHTQEILAALGYSAEELNQYQQQGVI